MGPCQHTFEILAFMPGVGIRNGSWVALNPMVQLKTCVCIAHERLSEHLNTMVCEVFR